VYDSQVRVLGEATTPTALPYRDEMTVLDVMIAVGGLTEFADGNKSRLVRVIDGQQYQALVRLEDLVKDGDISANVPIAPGDVIIIPEAWF
jgi:polysaccharide export outer membrane protein